MKENKRKIIWRIVELVMALIFFMLLIMVLRRHFPQIFRLLEKRDISGTEEYIRSEGSKGILLLILIQIVETISVILPAAPVYICAGAIYGKLAGMLVCYITNVIMNIIMFMAADKLKMKAEEFGEMQRNQKIEKIMSRIKRPDRIVFAMLILPVVPNGLIPVISAQTEMKLGEFLKGFLPGSLPMIVMYACFGDILVSRNYKVIVVILIVIMILVTLALVFRKQLTEKIEPLLKKFAESE